MVSLSDSRAGNLAVLGVYFQAALPLTATTPAWSRCSICARIGFSSSEQLPAASLQL